MTDWPEGPSHDKLAGANRGRLTLETTFYHYSLMLSLSLKCLLLLSLYVVLFSGFKLIVIWRIFLDRLNHLLF